MNKLLFFLLGVVVTVVLIAYTIIYYQSQPKIIKVDSTFSSMSEFKAPAHVYDNRVREAKKVPKIGMSEDF